MAIKGRQCKLKKRPFLSIILKNTRECTFPCWYFPLSRFISCIASETCKFILIQFMHMHNVWHFMELIVLKILISMNLYVFGAVTTFYFQSKCPQFHCFHCFNYICSFHYYGHINNDACVVGIQNNGHSWIN